MPLSQVSRVEITETSLALVCERRTTTVSSIFQLSRRKLVEDGKIGLGLGDSQVLG